MPHHQSWPVQSCLRDCNCRSQLSLSIHIDSE
jgi:hypothetical protein